MSEAGAALTRSPAAGSLRLAVLAGAIVLAAVQTRFTGPFLSDDAFITLRYAERLLAGEGLTWTAGERVEGYSNLLWLLLCAGGGALGFDLVDVARALGILCVALATGLLLRGRPLGGWRDLPAAAVGPLLFAASAPVATWTLGGLEGPLVLLLLTWGLLAAARGPSWRAGLPFALLCLTRPDGPLLGALVGGALWIGGTRALRPLLGFALLPLLAVGAQLLFRLAYHGALVPNTALVKTGGGAAAWAAGADYVGHGLAVLRGAALPALAGVAALWVHRAERGRGLLLLLPAVGWLLYLVVVGGDHFPGWRFLLPLLPACALATADLLARLAVTRRGVLVATAIALAAPALLVFDARTDPSTLQARAETWEQDALALGGALRTAFASSSPPPLLALEPAGAVAYRSGLPCLDLLGLCDREIASRPVSPTALALARSTMHRDFIPGHMRGSGEVLLARAPDLLVCSPPFTPLPLFTSGVEAGADPRFAAGWRCVVFAPDPQRRAAVWVRTARFVTTAADGSVTLPGFLLGSLRLHGALVPPGLLGSDGAGWTQATAWWQQPLPAVVAAADAVRRAPYGLLLASAAEYPGLPLRGRVRIAVAGDAGPTVALTRADGTAVAVQDGVAAIGAPTEITVRVARSRDGLCRIDHLTFTPLP